MVVLAQDEARALGHAHIGTEHLLLGLLREGEGIAAHALGSLGVTLDGARSRHEKVGDSPPTGQIPFTPHAKKALELGLRNALSFKHNYIGTEHLLLGLAAADPERLAEVGLGPEAVRDEVIRMLGGEATGAAWDYQLDTMLPSESIDARLEQLRADGWEILSVRVERRRKR